MKIRKIVLITEASIAASLTFLIGAIIVGMASVGNPSLMQFALFNVLLSAITMTPALVIVILNYFIKIGE